MNRNFASYFLLFLVLFNASCKSKKVLPKTTLPVIEKPSNSALLIQKINESQNTFSYYSAKGEANYKDNNMNENLDVFIVMEKDKYIWMSVTAIFGIEAARIKITPDSIIILDRLHRRCMIADFNYIKRMTNTDLRLHQLQQIVIGNTPFTNDVKKGIVDSLISGIAVYTLFDSQKQSAFYDAAFKLTKNIIEDKNINRQFIVEYSNTYIEGKNAYPTQVNINIRAEKNVECKFRLNNFAFDKKKEVQFSIPGNYEIVKP